MVDCLPRRRFPLFLLDWGRAVLGVGWGAVLSGCVVSTAGEVRFLANSDHIAAGITPTQRVSLVEQTGDLRFEIHRLTQAQIYLLRIPAGSSLTVEPVVATGLERLSSLAQLRTPGQGEAIAAINGGFFDPQNQQTTSHVIRQGQVLLDPNLNQDLLTNANVARYMDQILNRSEFRRYDCGGLGRYDIAFHDGAVPAGCDRRDALGAGPQLLPRMTHEEEAFWHVVAGQTVRNPIGMTQANARSAIALTADGGLLLAMVAQLPPSPPSPLPDSSPGRSGLNLAELAEFLRSQGAIQALNLDGGSSSSLFYNQRTYYGRLDQDGQPIQRAIKSALVVRRPAP